MPQEWPKVVSRPRKEIGSVTVSPKTIAPISPQLQGYTHQDSQGHEISTAEVTMKDCEANDTMCLVDDDERNSQ